jgi:hypothetical protein
MARREHRLNKQADCQKILSKVNSKFVLANYEMQHMLVAEDCKYIVLQNQQEALFYVRNTNYAESKDSQGLRKKLMTCKVAPKVIDIVQGNIPVLCKIYMGDREDPLLKFKIEDLNSPTIKDTFVYVSTESKTPNEKNFMKMYINLGKFEFCTKKNFHEPDEHSTESKPYQKKELVASSDTEFVYLALQSKNGCKIKISCTIIGKLKQPPADLLRGLKFNKSNEIAKPLVDVDKANNALTEYLNKERVSIKQKNHIKTNIVTQFVRDRKYLEQKNTINGFVEGVKQKLVFAKKVQIYEQKMENIHLD